MQSEHTPESPTRLRQRKLFVLHLVIYAIAWVGVLLDAVTTSYGYQPITDFPMFYLMLWTPLVMGHIYFFLRATARQPSIEDDRASYREGFRDAVQMLRDQGEDDLIERLGLDEEGELVPLSVEKRKRE